MLSVKLYSFFIIFSVSFELLHCGVIKTNSYPEVKTVNATENLEVLGLRDSVRKLDASVVKQDETDNEKHILENGATKCNKTVENVGEVIKIEESLKEHDKIQENLNGSIEESKSNLDKQINGTSESEKSEEKSDVTSSEVEKLINVTQLHRNSTEGLSKSTEELINSTLELIKESKDSKEELSNIVKALIESAVNKSTEELHNSTKNLTESTLNKSTEELTNSTNGLNEKTVNKSTEEPNNSSKEKPNNSTEKLNKSGEELNKTTEVIDKENPNKIIEIIEKATIKLLETGINKENLEKHIEKVETHTEKEDKNIEKLYVTTEKVVDSTEKEKVSTESRSTNKTETVNNSTVTEKVAESTEQEKVSTEINSVNKAETVNNSTVTEKVVETTEINSINKTETENNSTVTEGKKMTANNNTTHDNESSSVRKRREVRVRKLWESLNELHKRQRRGFLHDHHYYKFTGPVYVDSVEYDTPPPNYQEDASEEQQYFYSPPNPSAEKPPSPKPMKPPAEMLSPPAAPSTDYIPYPPSKPDDDRDYSYLPPLPTELKPPPAAEKKPSAVKAENPVKVDNSYDIMPNNALLAIAEGHITSMQKPKEKPSQEVNKPNKELMDIVENQIKQDKPKKVDLTAEYGPPATSYGVPDVKIPAPAAEPPKKAVLPPATSYGVPEKIYLPPTESPKVESPPKKELEPPIQPAPKVELAPPKESAPPPTSYGIPVKVPTPPVEPPKKAVAPPATSYGIPEKVYLPPTEPPKIELAPPKTEPAPPKIELAPPKESAPKIELAPPPTSYGIPIKEPKQSAPPSAEQTAAQNAKPYDLISSSYGAPLKSVTSNLISAMTEIHPLIALPDLQNDAVFNTNIDNGNTDAEDTESPRKPKSNDIIGNASKREVNYVLIPMDTIRDLSVSIGKSLSSAYSIKINGALIKE